MDILDKVAGSSWAGWINALIILLAGLLILKIVIVLIRKILAKSTIDGALHTLVINSVKVAALIVIIVSVLSELGVNTSTFIAVIGAAGAAIALALKDSLANVAGGIIILVTKPFGKGDYVMTNDIEGSVEEIDILNTTLKTVDNKVVSIPNSSISNSALINFTRTEARRVDLRIGVSYDAEIDKVKTVLAGVADSCSFVMKDRGYRIGVAEHGESAVIFDFQVWTKPENYWDVRYYLGEKSKEALDEAGIEIPYTHIDVIVKK